MTNDNDKLRRLREWIHTGTPGWWDFRGPANGLTDDAKAVVAMIDRLLNESTSPAPAAAPSEAESLIEACVNIDWQQHLLNGGGCFHVEDGKLCGRGRSWSGHQDRGPHLFVPLYVAVTKAVRSAATAPATSPPRQSTPIIATSATDGTVQEDHETDRQRHREPIPLPPAEDRQPASKAQHGDGGVPSSRQDAARHVPGRPGAVHGADEAGGGAHVGESGSGVRLPDGRLASPPVTSEAIEAAITELVGANRIEAAMAERQHKAAFPPGFVASKREVLRTLITSVIAEARGSSGLREAVEGLLMFLAREVVGDYGGAALPGWMSKVSEALAADAKEQTK